MMLEAHQAQIIMEQRRNNKEPLNKWLIQKTLQLISNVIEHEATDGEHFIRIGSVTDVPVDPTTGKSYADMRFDIATEELSVNHLEVVRELRKIGYKVVHKKAKFRWRTLFNKQPEYYLYISWCDNTKYKHVERTENEYKEINKLLEDVLVTHTLVTKGRYTTNSTLNNIQLLHDEYKMFPDINTGIQRTHKMSKTLNWIKNIDNVRCYELLYQD